MCVWVCITITGYTCWPHNPQWMQIDLSAALIWKAQRHIILIKWNDIEIIKSFIHFNLKFSPFLSLSLARYVCVCARAFVCLCSSFLLFEFASYLSHTRTQNVTAIAKIRLIFIRAQQERESLYMNIKYIYKCLCVSVRIFMYFICIK